MKNHLKALATCVLVSAMAAAHAQTTHASGTTAKTTTTTTTKAAGSKSAARRTTARRTTTKKTKAPRKPSVQSQIEELRTGMQQQTQQLQQLQQQLTESNAQLQQAQQSAAAAAASAQQAQAQSQQQAQTLTDNTTAVSSLQGAVSDLKTNSTSLAGTLQETQTSLNKKIDTPDAIHYQGITISPSGSFLAAETVYRNRATGGGINTPFTGIPFSNQEQAKTSEFYGSGRQSRIAITATGKAGNIAMKGYYEADFLSAGTTSNNNQSNSYTLRQRQVWAQAKLNSGLSFTGGQMWSLAAEDKTGEENGTEILPSTIDPQYVAGYVWARQYGFRVVQDMGHHFWLGASVENAQVPSISGRSLPPNTVIGLPGTGGGLYNPTANYASNVAPDVIAKAAFEPGFGGHYEIFGIGRFFRNRVYPNVRTVNGTVTGTAAGAFNDTTVGGGIGGSLRVPTFHKHLDVGVKGLWGDGVGRYGSSQVGDLTLRPNGQLALIHGFSALGTLELHATPRLDIYVNYGADQDFRRYFFTNASRTATEGFGGYAANNSGCFTEPIPAAGGYSPGSQTNCNADTKDVQEAVLGYWYDIYKGDKGRLRQGIQYSYFERHSWSGAGGLAPKGNDNGVWTSFRYYLPTSAGPKKQ